MMASQHPTPGRGQGSLCMEAGSNRMLKNGHLLRFPHPSSLQRTVKYASLLRISGALHLALFEQPGKDDFFSSLIKSEIRSKSKIQISKS